jgi:hypothetical protein
MTDMITKSRAAVRAQVPPPSTVKELHDRIRRRHKRHTTTTAAVVSFAALLATASIVAQSSSTSTRATETTARTATVATSTPDWLSVPRPSRYPFLLTTSVGPTGSYPAFVALSQDQSKTVSIREASSDEIAGRPFAESVDLGGRTVSITSESQSTTVEISVRLDRGQFVIVKTIGLTELDTRVIATQLAVFDTLPVNPIAIQLPVGFDPFVRVDDSDALVTSVYGAAPPQFVAYVTVNRTRETAIAKLHDQVGALRPMTVDGRDVLVGTLTMASNLQLTVAAVDTDDGHTVTAVGGGDGNQLNDLVRLVLDTRPVDDKTMSDAKAEQQNAPPLLTDDCLTTQPSDRSLVIELPAYTGPPFTMRRSESIASGPGLCISNTLSGEELHPSASGQVNGQGDGGGWTLYGIVNGDVTEVRVELTDGSTVSAITHTVPNYPYRVWLIGFPSSPTYRAFEQLDSAGTVISRQGRPPR